jgi:PAS domain S-box-containing protein
MDENSRRVGMTEVASARPGRSRGAVATYLLAATALLLLVGNVTIGARTHVQTLVLAAATTAAWMIVRQMLELRRSRLLFEQGIEQSARFRTLIRLASDIVLIVDSHGTVTYANPTSDRILGPGTIVPGQSLKEIFAEGDRAIVEAMEAGGDSDGVPRQAAMRTAAGGWLPVEVMATDLRAEPAVNGTVLTCREIVERIELERQLQRVADIGAVGVLATGLAHDFNNLLSVIRGYAQLLEDDWPPGSSEHRDLLAIGEAADHAGEVTRRLMAFSRTRQVELACLDINDVLAGMSPLLRQLRIDGVQIEMVTAPDLWPVVADPSHLEEVVVTLVSHARSRMPGGGRVCLTTSNHRTTEAGGDGTVRDAVALSMSCSAAHESSSDGSAAIDGPLVAVAPWLRDVSLWLVQAAVADIGGRLIIDASVPSISVQLPRASGTEPLEAGLSPASGEGRP